MKKLCKIIGLALLCFSMFVFISCSGTEKDDSSGASTGNSQSSSDLSPDSSDSSSSADIELGENETPLIPYN